MSTLISIVTPAYNAERFISCTIESVIAQTHTFWELLIVLDPKSTDTTRTIVDGYALKDSRIRVILSELGGVSNNRNLAISTARGEYIAFLDSDDLWHPEKLESQIQFMLKNNFQATCHSYQPISEDGHKKFKVREAKAQVSYRDLLSNNTIGCLTVMLKKEAIPQPSFCDGPHEDLTLWLRISRAHNFYGIPRNLAYYRLVSGSRSNNKILAAQNRWYILRTVEGLPLWSAAIVFIKYAYSSLRKRG